MGWKVTRLENETVREYTLGDVLAAIEQNGLPKADGAYWLKPNHTHISANASEFEVGSACAMGQGALNLNTDYNTLHLALKDFRNSKGRDLGDSIIGRNDGHKWSLKSIGRYYREKFHSRLNDKVLITEKFKVTKEN